MSKEVLINRLSKIGQILFILINIRANMFSNEVGIIVWKHSDKYRCYVNNCSIKNNITLETYMKSIAYDDKYESIINNHEDQIIHISHHKIILKYIPSLHNREIESNYGGFRNEQEDIILEIRVPTNINVQLLSSLSHKVRNPLSNIFGILTIIDKTRLGKTDKEYINILKKSCYDIIAVMNDIIDIVNSVRGELKLSPEKASIKQLLEECHGIVDKEIKEKNLILKFKVDNDVPEEVIIDKTKLKQIIVNMITNSIQHTTIGGIVINVSLFNEDNNMDCPFPYVKCQEPLYNILFSIKDTGTGMDNAKRKIVESVIGINKDIDKSHHYTGLGLTISKFICNLMGGNIWFKTEHNIGSIFNFNILCQA